MKYEIWNIALLEGWSYPFQNYKKRSQVIIKKILFQESLEFFQDIVGGRIHFYGLLIKLTSWSFVWRMQAEIIQNKERESNSHADPSFHWEQLIILQVFINMEMLTGKLLSVL